MPPQPIALPDVVLLPAVSRRVIAFLTTPDALQLRASCARCRDIVASHQWHDAEGRIRHELSSWTRGQSRSPRHVARTDGPRAT
jgi:hypothetical protein